MKNRITFLVFTVFFMTMFACKQEVKLTADEAREIDRETCVYGFPMAVNYKTIYLYIQKNLPSAEPGLARL